MSTTVVSDLDVQALVDGELDGEEKSRVQNALRTNPMLKSRYDQLVMQRRLVFMAWSEEERESLH